MKPMIFLLYLIQSLFYGFYGSLPLTYTQIPDYRTLSVFAAAGLPYSLKFIMAPFEQRFYIKSYGKRKTWIIGSLLLMVVITLFLSQVVGENEYQFMAAVLLMLSLFASALKDVSTDALAIETIENSSTISTISFASEQIGKTIALSLFLALISKGYWADYGINHAIISASTFMHIVAGFIFLSALGIHFLYKEKAQNQNKVQGESFWSIIKHYRYFIDHRYQLCRLAVLLLTMNHGIMYYWNTFEYEFIRNNLIERQTLMFVSDACLIPSVIACFFLGRIVDSNNMFRIFIRVYLALLTILMLSYYIDSTSRLGIITTTVTIKLFNSMKYYLALCLINEISKGTYSGINITGLLSFYNFGVNSAIHNQVIYLVGYHTSMKLGFAIAFVFSMSLPWMIKWVRTGEKISVEKLQ